MPRKKVLHRKTKRVKINKAIIISTELTDEDKILNNARCNGNITKELDECVFLCGVKIDCDICGLLWIGWVNLNFLRIRLCVEGLV
jgi:hypothetical protein